jgi:hypothetical protein
MNERKGLLGSGLGMVLRNKRYIVWFYLLNLILAVMGITAFSSQVQSILEHSLAADRLLHGFDFTVFVEMLSRPEFGPGDAASMSAGRFAVLFLLLTTLFLPGVFQGYASTYRLPGTDFFRACGRNLWRFIRLMIVAGIVMGITTALLFMLNGAHVKHAGESTNELLPFEMQILGLFVIFLIMTVLRIWFDLAEADVVLNDRRAVRKSIASGLRHTFRSLGRLLASYVFTTLVAAVVLLAGLFIWLNFVPPASVVGAFLVGQLTLFLLLIPRFWQRGVAVSYWQQHMIVPVVPVQPIIPMPMQPVSMQPVVPLPAPAVQVPSPVISVPAPVPPLVTPLVPPPVPPEEKP